LGTLGERVDAMRAKETAPDSRPTAGRHVWVQTAAGPQAGWLTCWDRHADGTWWGRVVVVEEPGSPFEVRVRADLLKPA